MARGAEPAYHAAAAAASNFVVSALAVSGDLFESAGIDPKVILDDGLFPGFNLQGDRFSDQIIFIPEMLITARAMKAASTPPSFLSTLQAGT